MELMQFTAIVLMAGLTLKLLMLPRRVEENSVTSMSRRLMLGGIALLGLQFVLQMALGLREKSVTQAVTLNLTAFTLVSWVMSLSILRLLTQGQLKSIDRWLGGTVWLTEMVMIVVGGEAYGETLFSDTPMQHIAAQLGSMLYFAMQCYYDWTIVARLHRIRRSLDDYYDNDMSQRLDWMRVSINVLVVLALFVPAAIFLQGQWLMGFAVVFFYGTWYLVDCFCDYVKSSMPRKVQEAEKSEEDSEEAAATTNHTPKMNDAQWERMEAFVARWTGQGGYRKNGLKKSVVAEQMGVSENQLTLWLRQHDLKFADWLSDLRVEEAKRIIKLHPDWTNETIAEHCGFADRPDLQRKFKRYTGMTPMQYAGQ